ncbi:hypothetical protein [Metallosphaera sp.]|uniref:hypothetical protein n=1 Tax=Metallosphaera sp. TaxID=2020860 RepID=UPI00317B12A3
MGIVRTLTASKYKIDYEYREKLRSSIQNNLLYLNAIVQDEIGEGDRTKALDYTEVYSSLKQGLLNIIFKLSENNYHIVSVYYSRQTSKAVTPSDVKRDLMNAKKWFVRNPLVKPLGRTSFTFIYIADRITLNAEKYLKEEFKRVDWFKDESGYRHGPEKDGILVLRLRRYRELIPIDEINEIIRKDFLSRISKSMSQILVKRLFTMIYRIIYDPHGSNVASDSRKMIGTVGKILSAIHKKIDVGAKKVVLHHAISIADDFLKHGKKVADSYNFLELFKYFGYRKPENENKSNNNKRKIIPHEKVSTPVTPNMGTVVRKRVINQSTGELVDKIPPEIVLDDDEEANKKRFYDKDGVIDQEKLVAEVHRLRGDGKDKNEFEDDGVVEEYVPEVDDIRYG